MFHVTPSHMSCFYFSAIQRTFSLITSSSGKLLPMQTVKRTQQCVSDSTAVLQWIFSPWYLFPVDKVGHTHPHTHTHMRTKTTASISADREVSETQIVKTLEMSHHFMLRVFPVISDSVYWCYFNTFPIIFMLHLARCLFFLLSFSQTERWKSFDIISTTA